MKKILSIILAAVMLFSVFSVCSFAAEAGTLVSNAIQLTSGKWYTKYWTYNNQKLNCYNRIDVTSKGYITFEATKPFDDEGELGTYFLTLYNENGDVVWEADTEPQKTGFKDTYVYKIGLNKGTYYMNIDPSFFIYSDSAPISTSHRYTFTASSYWEIEDNSTQAKATKISLDKMYTGVFAEQSHNVPQEDYYAVSLKKDTKYRVKIENYTALDASSFTLFCILDPSGNVISASEKESGSEAYWDITAKKTGTYYLKIYNGFGESGVEYKIGVYLRKISAKKLKASLSKTKYAYDGSVKKPTVTVKDGSTKLKEGTHYTVKYSSGCKKIGEYKVTLTFKGNYTGTKTLKYQIAPAKVNYKKIKATQSTKAITLSWPKIDGATGYYVYQYSAKKDKYVKVGTVTKAKFKKEKLKAGTEYSYKVSAYKKLKDGTIIEGSQSTRIKTATECVAPKITSYRYYTFGDVNIEWTEVTGATGYQVYYSTKKSSGYKRYKSDYPDYYDWLDEPAPKACRGKRMYVKVRAYKKVSGKTIYSSWSPVKSLVLK